MALLRWGDEEEKKREDLLNPQPVNTVASVQSGWQPTQAMDDTQGDDTQIQGDNYLVSDEKAAVDQQIQQRREAEAAAKAEAQRQAAIARENEARARAADEMAQAQPVNQGMKYGGGEKKNEGGFTGFLKDVGSGIQQGLGALGDIAIQGGAVIGSIGKNDEELVRHMEQSQKVREWLYGFKDINGNNLKGTSDVDEAASRVSSGQGSLEDFAAVGGKSLQAGIDATMFMNPARLAAAGLKPVTAQSANLLARTASNPAVRYAARDAAFFGSLQGTATFQRVYAETGGDLEAAAEAALTDAAVGGVLQGSLDLAGNGVNVAANRTVNSLRRPKELTPVDEAIEMIEGTDGVFTPVRDEASPTVNDPAFEDGNVSFESPTQPPNFEPIADNLTPVLEDGVSLTPEPMTEWADELNGQKPADADEVMANEVAAVREQQVEPAPVVADGVAQTPPVVPVENLPTVKSEEVRALQDARAGTSQAEEAAINQRLQELTYEAPIKYERPALSEDEAWKDSLEKFQQEYRKEQNAEIPELHRYDSAEGNPNVESLSNYSAGRGTGGWGTGVYFNIAKQADREGGKSRHSTVKNSLEDPFIIRDAEQSHAVNDFGKLLTKAAQGADVDEFDLYRAASKAKLPYDANLVQRVIDHSRNEVGGRAVGVGDKSLANVDQPINHFMRAFGHDGIINKGVDDSTAGSVVFRGTKAYENAMRQLEEAKTPKAEEVPTADSDPYERAGITEADDYDTSLQKIDDALDEGRITEEEHADLEDELFDIAEQNGDAIAAKTGDDNLPDGLTPAKAGDEPVLSERDINKQIANKVMRHTDTNKDAQADLARAVGLSKDAATDVRTLLKDGGVEGRKAERIANLFEQAEKISESNKAIQKQYRKDFVKTGVDGIDDAPARVRNRETGEAGDLQRRLNSEIRKLELKGDMKERLLQGFENVVQGRNANMLTSASVIEKSVTADLWATLGYAAKNPIKMARGMTKHGNVAKNAAKSSARGWKDTPKTVSDSYKYLIGNVYHTAMTPAQIAADFRKGAVRTELAKWIYKNQTGKNLSSAQAEKFSRTFGADVEALVNMGAGVENGTISDLAYRRALKDFKKFIETGDEGDYSTYLANIDRQNSLAAAMAKGVGSEKLGRFGASVVNGLLPYMRNAKNMTVKSFTRDLNPFAKSLVDEIRADQVGAAANLYNLLKNKAVDYGVLAMLASTLEYNDGDDVSKPQGVSIHLGGDTYFPVRGTPIELPLALVAMTKEIVEDTTDGKPKEWQYYAGMIKSSIPYLDYMEQATNVMDSVTNIGGKEGDNGYAAKAYGINLARSLTPFSNNAVMPYVEGKQGNSVDAKKVYDKDPLQWYENSLKNAYNVDRDSLDTSRDAAGRVRTMDNQGSFINKGINDDLTKRHNDTITSLVKYGRDNGLARDTQDMFNTYDTGKNNSFKGIQDAITFLDVEEGADGKKSPKAEDKLKDNEKIADLAAQIRDGFFGDTGDNLLMLGDEQLYSDVSVPNKNGTKNSRLPLNMQSIKNAIAATDLPEEQRNRMYEISQANQALYDRRKAGEITYDQEQAMKAQNEQEYVNILSNSENYKKLGALMSTLDEQGFFEVGGIGSTKAGQTYLWNSLNSLLGSKGATPAAQWDSGKSFTPWGSGRGGGGGGSRATHKPGDRKNEGVKWTPVGKRGMATVQSGKYTPVQIKVKLGNAVKKNKTQNYSDRSF